MSFVTWKLVHTPYQAGYDSSGDSDTDITDSFKHSYTTAIGDSRDTFSFKLLNSYGKYSNKINPRDRIIIYRAVDSLTVNTDTDLLAVCTVTDIPEKVSSTNRELSIKGYNYSETVLNAIIFTDPLSSNQTIPEALESGLLFMQSNINSNFVVWSDTNPTVTSSGAPFPEIEERFYYKPYRQLIEKYSSSNYTEDGRYYWYINRNNELIWRKEENKSSYDFNYETNTDFFSYEVSKDTKDIINSVIIKGGISPRGKSVSKKVDNYSSQSKHGQRTKYVVEDRNFIGFVNEQDILNLGGDPSDGTLPSSIAGFSYPSTNFTWLRYTEFTSITSDKDYDNKLRDYVQESFLAKTGNEIIRFNANGKLNITIGFQAGRVFWGLGDVISVTAPNISGEEGVTVTKNLRVKEIRYVDSSEFYVLEEDIGTF